VSLLPTLGKFRHSASFFAVADYGYGFAPLAPQRAIPRWVEQDFQAMQRLHGGVSPMSDCIKTSPPSEQSLAWGI